MYIESNWFFFGCLGFLILINKFDYSFSGVIWKVNL